MEPFGVFETIKKLRSATDLAIEMHAHDDLGLATANTMAAALAGATHLNTTVNGLGERAGNAVEEVVVGSNGYPDLIPVFPCIISRCYQNKWPAHQAMLLAIVKALLVVRCSAMRPVFTLMAC